MTDNFKNAFLLADYEATGYTAEQIKIMDQYLRSQCWACEHGIPYRKQFSGVYEKNDKLTICEAGKHNNDTIAKIEQKIVTNGNLKQNKNK